MAEQDPSGSADKICGLCDIKESKYCCPRCNILYCSLDCYRSNKHMECSEEFYKGCVQSEMDLLEPDDEANRKMKAILQKIHSQCSNQEELDELMENVDNNFFDSDDDDEVELVDRIKDINLDNADMLWDALTQDEKNEFEALISKGDIDRLLLQWKPWWMYSKDKKKVVDLANNNEEEEALKECPKLKHVAKLNELTATTPSPAIKFNITNVLASYAFIMRYFNGEISPVEGAAYLLNICANLDTNANFEDAAIAVESVVQKCIQSELIDTDEESLQVMKSDTVLLIQGPSEENANYYSRAALSHIHQLLTKAKTDAKCDKLVTKTPQPKSTFSTKFPEQNTAHLPDVDISKIKKCIRKVEYYLSYVVSHGIRFE